MAQSGTIGSLRAEATVDTGGWKSDLAEMRDTLKSSVADMRSAVEEFKSSGEDMMKTLGGMKSNSDLLAGSIAALGLGFGLKALIDTIVGANHGLAEMAASADRLGVSLGRMQEIKFSANVSGLSDAQFQAGLEKMAGGLQDSLRDTNDISKILDANNIKYKDGEKIILDTNGLLAAAAKIIQGFPNGFDKIKAAELLGLTKEWVPFLDQGADAINAMAAKAKDAGAVIDDRLIAKAVEFDKAWKLASASWAAGMKSSAGEILPLLNDIVGVAIQVVNAVGAVYNPDKDSLNWNTPISDMSQAQLEARIKNLQQLSVAMEEKGPSGLSFNESLIRRIVGDDADLAAINAMIVEVQMRLNALKGQSAPLKLTLNKSGAGSKFPEEDASKDAFDRAVDQANKRIAVMNAETATIGLNSEARERARLVATLEEAAKKANTEAGKKNTDVTKDQREEIDKLADRMTVAATKARETQQAWQSINQTAQFSGQTAATAFESFLDGAKNIDIASAALKQFRNALINAFFTGQGPLAGLLGTASTVSGGTGGIAGLFGGVLKSLFAGGHAAGGVIPAGQWGIVGENGPEPVFAGASPLNVMPNSSLQGASGGGTVTHNLTVKIDGARGSAEIATAVRQGVTTGLRAYDVALPGRINDIQMNGV